jgi:phosphoserine phosphatase RsbU/P
MGLENRPRILLCADSTAEVSDIRRLLLQARHHVDNNVLGDSYPPDLSAYQTVVLNGNATQCLAFHQKLRSQITDGYLPTLCINADPTPAARLASLESGADAYLIRPFDPAELLAQVRVLLRNKERHDSLTEKTAEIHRINKQLHKAYQQIDEELELASRIQESFLPQSLPEVPEVRFAVHYQPCGRVGGDFYDIFRLDEKHMGFYVADAMGHGVPASLLTIFVKTGVRAKEIVGKQYHLIPPDEVLQRLNRDLIHQHLSDTPFITMVYALLDFRKRTLSFSRSGHPHPVYVPRDGQPTLWPAEGGLLGVFDTRYMVRTERLQPGDKVLLYTDGIDTAFYPDAAAGAQSLLAYASKFREAPIEEMVRRLPQELFKTTRQTDDLTVLGFEILDEPTS